MLDWCEGWRAPLRLKTGSRPQNIYAVRADLSSPNIGLRASEDDRGTEWYVNTLDFAENVRPNSRLSCQIEMSEELDGLTVILPAKQVDVS